MDVNVTFRRRSIVAVVFALVVGLITVGVPTPAFAEAEAVVDDLTLGIEPSDALGDANAAVPATASTRQLDLDPFDMIGITLRSDLHTAVRVRVLTEGGWSEWAPLTHDDEADGAHAHGPDEAGLEAAHADEVAAEHAEGGVELTTTEPVWAGGATGFEMAFDEVPGEVTVHLVRPGDRTVELTEGAEPAAAAPAVETRSAWGARPPRDRIFQADEVRFAVVHHTATTTSYSSGEVPTILRSIQAYHMFTRGWSDIGYNFVIDRFGRTWEARAGGMRNPVQGAHTAGFNSGSVGVAFLGDHNSRDVNPASIDAAGRLIGWKLAMGQHNPSGTTSEIAGNSPRFRFGQSVTVPRVTVHGDLGQTSCPGSFTRRHINRIRAVAGAEVWASTQADRARGTHLADIDGDGRDEIFIDREGGWATDVSPSRSSAGRPSRLPQYSRGLVGDFNNNGAEDIVWYGYGNFVDRAWWGEAGKGIVRTTVPGQVSKGYRPTIGDYNGDGRDDILWQHPTQRTLRMWRTPSSTRTRSYSVPGGLDARPYSGDFNGDGFDDVVMFGPGRRADQIWWGSRTRPLGVRTSIGDHSANMRPLIADVNGDGRDDILWYEPGASNHRLWTGNSSGNFTNARVDIPANRRLVAGDFTGDGVDDVVAVRGSSASTYPGTRGGGLRAPVNSSVAVGNDHKVGDVDGDRKDDLVITSTRTGRAVVVYGRSDARLAESTTL